MKATFIRVPGDAVEPTFQDAVYYSGPLLDWKKVTQSLHVCGHIKSIYPDQRAPICSMTYGTNTTRATP